MLQRGTKEDVEVIPATELRNILQITLHSVSMLTRKPLSDYAEETTLALSAAHVAEVKQALQSVNLILDKSLHEEVDNIGIGTSAVRTTESEKVEQTIKSRLVGQGAILGIGVVGLVLETAHKLVSHSSFSFFSLISSWTRGL